MSFHNVMNHFMPMSYPPIHLISSNPYTIHLHGHAFTFLYIFIYIHFYNCMHFIANKHCIHLFIICRLMTNSWEVEFGVPVPQPLCTVWLLCPLTPIMPKISNIVINYIHTYIGIVRSYRIFMEYRLA